MAMAQNRISVKVKILTQPTRRGKSFSASCIDSLSKTIKTVFINNPAQVQAGNHYLLRNVTLGDFIRVTENSVVLHCGKFDFPSDLEKDFFNPPTVSVEEALCSPKKRRVTVSGQLSEVSSLMQTENTVRKVVTLTNGQDNFSIKLWGDQTKLKTPPVGSQMKISCVNINEFRGTKEANSTEVTQIEELSEEVPFEGVIDAAAFGSTDASIVINDELLAISNTMLQNVFQNMKFEAGVSVKGMKRGTRITTLYTDSA